LLNFKDIREKLLTVFIFTGIFLPVRLFFYTYVSTWWLGSFGLISAIMISLLYFSNKGKLGWLGRIVNKQVTRLSKGKAGIGAICVSIFLLISFGNMLYGMSNPPEPVVQQFKDALRDEGVTDLDSYTEKAKDVRLDWLELILGTLAVLFIMVVPTEPGYALFSIINGWSQGWMAHFMTVILVQEIEVLGLVIYFRYFYKPKVIQTTEGV